MPSDVWYEAIHSADVWDGPTEATVAWSDIRGLEPYEDMIGAKEQWIFAGGSDACLTGKIAGTVLTQQDGSKAAPTFAAGYVEIGSDAGSALMVPLSLWTPGSAGTVMAVYKREAIGGGNGYRMIFGNADVSTKGVMWGLHWTSGGQDVIVGRNPSAGTTWNRALSPNLSADAWYVLFAGWDEAPADGSKIRSTYVGGGNGYAEISSDTGTFNPAATSAFGFGRTNYNTDTAYAATIKLAAGVVFDRRLTQAEMQTSARRAVVMAELQNSLIVNG